MLLIIRHCNQLLVEAVTSVTCLLCYIIVLYSSTRVKSVPYHQDTKYRRLAVYYNFVYYKFVICSIVIIVTFGKLLMLQKQQAFLLQMLFITLSIWLSF